MHKTSYTFILPFKHSFFTVNVLRKNRTSCNLTHCKTGNKKIKAEGIFELKGTQKKLESFLCDMYKYIIRFINTWAATGGCTTLHSFILYSHDELTLSKTSLRSHSLGVRQNSSICGCCTSRQVFSLLIFMNISR